MKKWLCTIIHKGRSGNPVFRWERLLERILVGSVIVYLALSICEAVIEGVNL